MSNLLLFGLLVVLLIAAQINTAKTVEEVIERYVEERGGLNKLASIHSIYMEGRREVMGQEMQVRITKEQDKLNRTELVSDQVEGLILITPENAWTYLPQKSPGINKIQEEEQARIRTEMDIAGPLVDFTKKGHTVELLGKDKIDDHNCYKIKLITTEGITMIFWVDTSSYLLVQSSVAISPGTNEAKKTTFTLYKNYKSVDGIRFAHTHEIRAVASTGSSEGIIHFDKIELNQDIDPAMFLPHLD